MAYTAYADEDALATYLHRVLDRGGFATDLGWSVVGASYQDVINETLRRYGTSDVSTVTSNDGIAALNAIGRAELWGQVAEATAHWRSATLADGTRASLEQAHEHALQMQAEAEEEAAALGYGDEAYQVGIVQVAYRHDPYEAIEAE